MTRRSAGLLVYRKRADVLEVLLAHPGGPFWARKDEGAWTIPKGEIEPDEDSRAAARREFAEETGLVIECDDEIALTPLRQRSGKVIEAWAVEADVDAGTIVSNTFAMEWPPRSGKQREFPEIDRAEWFAMEAARRKITPGQRPFLVELQRRVR